jgi:uncharacterized protein
MEILTAFLIGFAGSIHCIGMCGPIAASLPFPSSQGSFYLGRFLYNVGRIITYAFMGLILGAVGKGIALAGFQQALSIFLGVAILIIVLTPLRLKNYLTGYHYVNKFISPLKSSIGKLFKKNSSSSLFSIGILNGFLPCGLVYLALAGAAASGSPINGMLFMSFFGLGTAPALFSLSIFGKFMGIKWRDRLRKSIPVFAIILAIIFILRGMNLGIPYLSPKINASAVTIESNDDCH